MTAVETSPGRASSAQISAITAALDREGYALVERVLDARQLGAARAGVQWAMGNVPGSYKWIKQRTYEWVDHPIFVEIIEHPLVIDVAAQYLGPDFHLIAAQCSRNAPEEHYAPGVMQIHQDACFFPTAERARDGVPVHRYGFSAMWYLQDTPLEMGPTELVVGSHLHGERQHTNDRLATDGTPVWRAPIPAGSLLFFLHRTWHRGAPNTSKAPRDLITNAYARREVDKVQLTLKQSDGTDQYVAPDQLMGTYSPTVRRLLSES